MERRNNAEIRHGGDLIRAKVDVELDTSVAITGPNAGSVEWGGVLHPPNNIGLALGENYTLVLQGFSPAKIQITSEANPIDSAVTFRGVGQPPTGVRSKQVQKTK